MITEDYVSFELAELLREKGFNEASYASIKVFGGNEYEVNGKWIKPSVDTIIPTLQTAMKWLREKHYKSIEIRSQGLKATSLGWIVEIYNLVNQDEEFHHPYTFPTYEEACEAAIKYCLENLI